MRNRDAFTLIELLVVIAIVAILAVVVVLVLNPAQLLQQARDSNRLSDLASMNSALGYYIADASLNGSVSLGSANTVYASVPDASATSTSGDQCQGLPLPTMPSPYSWRCEGATYRKTDSTGWMPVNFSGMSTGSPLGQLPADPTNASSSRLWYTYSTNGSQYQLTAAMESAKYRLGGSGDVLSGDGGTLATVVEKGTKLGLEPLDYGDPALAGLWTFDEGTSTVAYDYSGSNATGSWSGATPYYATGRVGANAGSFNGSNDDVSVPQGSSAKVNLSSYGSFTLSGWVNTASSSAQQTFLGTGNPFNANGNGLILTYNYPTAGRFGLVLANGLASDIINDFGASSALPLNTWTHVAVTFTSQAATLYMNGASVGSISLAGQGVSALGSSPLMIGEYGVAGVFFWNGLIDDVRVYNRALSAAEVQALYNGGK